MQANNFHLLTRLDRYPNAILVTGCQRSGTTMLSRVIRESAEIEDHTFGSDDELAGALILSVLVEYNAKDRCCFQTTYVDQKYWEYLEHRGQFKMVWVVRNPFSTVYSLLYNWPRSALDNTFEYELSLSFNGFNRWKYRLLGYKSFDNVSRACLIHDRKLARHLELQVQTDPIESIVVDYED